MKLSQIVEAVGDFELDVDDGDVVTDLVVVGRIKRLDQEAKSATVLVGSSDGCDIVVKIGLLKAASDIESQGWALGED